MQYVLHTEKWVWKNLQFSHFYNNQIFWLYNLQKLWLCIYFANENIKETLEHTLSKIAEMSSTALTACLICPKTKRYTIHLNFYSTWNIYLCSHLKNERKCQLINVFISWENIRTIVNRNCQRFNSVSDKFCSPNFLFVLQCKIMAANFQFICNLFIQIIIYWELPESNFWSFYCDMRVT